MTASVPPLPPRVVAFVRAHVSSLLQLEALLLVFEAGDRMRTAADVAGEMYLPARVVAGWLQEFASSGFCLECDGGFRVSDDADTYDLLGDVAATYLRRKVSMGRLVFGPEEDRRITLAEAFRLRKDPRRDP